jgi:hypothetical protein
MMKKENDMSTEKSIYEGWTILELMGHRRLGGHVSEATIAGASLLRLDVYLPGDEKPMATQFYSASAIYCITPTTEELARAVAKSNVPAPVQRWELPALPAKKETGGDEGEEQDTDEPGF